MAYGLNPPASVCGSYAPGEPRQAARTPGAACACPSPVSEAEPQERALPALSSAGPAQREGRGRACFHGCCA